MDDFNVSSLHESKNEWGARLLTILTPLIIEGLKSIFDESYNLCKTNNEYDKYLMTFQNFISRIPNWNVSVIEQETKRIIDKSHCGYLEELITCVHIIQLKLLTSMRVGQKQKKIDINIPKLGDFVHKTYINVARKIYKNVYLFENKIPPLQIQKNNRELEIIIQECILNTIRDSIPIENILKAYMDETVEEDVIEDIKEEEIIQEQEQNHNIEHINSDQNTSYQPIANSQVIKFNDVDTAHTIDNREELINAPKNIERLEELSTIRNTQRKENEQNDDDADENIKIKILDQHAELTELDIHNIEEPRINLNNNDFLLDDIEILT
jgi:hypothetical protein